MRHKWGSRLVLLAGLAASGLAWADGGHPYRGGHPYHGDGAVRGGIYVRVGPPGFAPWYYGPPYYYPYRPYYAPYYPYYPYYAPPMVVVPSAPPTYIEKSAPQEESSLPPGYWYYCSQPEGYYPSVKECPGGWQQVPPQPPPRP